MKKGTKKKKQLLRRCLALWVIVFVVLSTVAGVRPLRAATPFAAEPLISQGVPAYTSDDCFGSKPASLANDNDYSSYWRSCNAEPSVGTPVTLTYDLSGVSAAQRNHVVVVWYNDTVSGPYDPTLISNNSYNTPGDYTLQANAAAGGTQPSTGWVMLTTVTGNHYHSRQQALDLTGYKWIRLSVTASFGSTLNQDVAVNMDVHNISADNLDNWIFFGDSITQAAFLHLSDYGNTFGQQINAFNTSYYPIDESGGVGGFTAADGAANIATWLATSPAHFVTLNYGTNDANNGGAYLTSFKDNMKTMIDAAIAAGRTVIIPLIPWGGTANLQANVPTLNAVIEQLYTEYPQIVPGPDLYSYFSAHQGLISGDNIHPTTAGYTAYRTQWVDAMETAVYSVPTLNASPVAGTFDSAQSVTFSASKAGKVYYTTDGSTPTTASTVYSAPITLSSTTTLKAIAVDTAGNQSDVAGGTYTISTPSSSSSDSTSNSSSSNTGTTVPTHVHVSVTTTPEQTAAPEESAPSETPTTPEPAQATNLKQVQVTITDDHGNPLPNVTVTLHSVPQTTTTDSNGVATFYNVAPGEHTIAIESPDYMGSRTITVANDALASTYQFSLTVQAKPSFPWAIVWWVSGVTIVLLLVVIIVIRRRKRPAPPTAAYGAGSF